MKWKTMLSGFISLLVMTSIVTFPIGLIDHGEAVSMIDPYFIIYLDHDKYYVDVYPGSDGIVKVTGNVTVSSYWNEVQSYTVYLLVDGDGWPTSAPESMTFTKEKTTIPFNASIQIPIGTSSMIMGLLSISGRWSTDSDINGGIIENKTAAIFVNKYYDLTVESEETHANANIGDSLGFKCTLINHGNGKDRVSVEIVNRDELTNMSWVVQLSQENFQIPEKQERVLTVSVTVGNLTSLGNHSIKLRFLSAEAEALGVASYTLEMNFTVEVEKGESELPNIGVAPLIALIILISALISLIQRRRR